MENKFGNFIRKLRGKESLRDVANRCGISHTHIADLEKGKNRSTKSPIKPSIDTIRALSKAYNYSYNELLDVAGYVDDPTEERKETHSLETIDKAIFNEFMRLDPKKRDKLRRIMEIVKED